MFIELQLAVLHLWKISFEYSFEIRLLLYFYAESCYVCYVFVRDHSSVKSTSWAIMSLYQFPVYIFPVYTNKIYSSVLVYMFVMSLCRGIQKWRHFVERAGNTMTCLVSPTATGQLYYASTQHYDTAQQVSLSENDIHAVSPRWARCRVRYTPGRRHWLPR